MKFCNILKLVTIIWFGNFSALMQGGTNTEIDVFAVNSATPLTLEQVAPEKIKEPLNQLILDMEVRLHDEVMPHEVKTLRKEFRMVRDQIDIFLPFYPLIKNDHPLLALRELIDEGYEKVLGPFKDISDSLGLDPLTASDKDYKGLEKKIKIQRKIVLNYQSHFFDALAKINFGAQDLIKYLDAPAYDAARIRDSASEFSRFYWGLTLPEVGRSASYNVHNLMLTLTTKFSKAYNQVVSYKFDDVFKGRVNQKSENITEEEDHFHDLRKYARSLLNLMTYFDDLRTDEYKYIGTELYDSVSAIYETYGAIHDCIIRYHNAEKDAKCHPLKKTLKSVDKDNLEDLWKDVFKNNNYINELNEKVELDIVSSINNLENNLLRITGK